MENYLLARIKYLEEKSGWWKYKLLLNNMPPDSIAQKVTLVNTEITRIARHILNKSLPPKWRRGPVSPVEQDNGFIPLEPGAPIFAQEPVQYRWRLLHLPEPRGNSNPSDPSLQGIEIN